MMMEGTSLWEAVAQGWGRLELRDREGGGRGRAYGAREGGPTGWGVMDLLKRQWLATTRSNWVVAIGGRFVWEG